MIAYIHDETDIKEKDKLKTIYSKIVNFDNKSRTKSKNGHEKKKNTLDSINALYEDLEIILNKYFQWKKNKEKDWKYELLNKCFKDYQYFPHK